MKVDRYAKKTYNEMEVRITKWAQKQLDKVPNSIARKFEYWCDLVGYVGLREVRKQKGYHDEPLKGQRKGQRSVRLSKAYRVIYRELKSGAFEVIEIIEVNKHEY